MYLTNYTHTEIPDRLARRVLEVIHENTIRTFLKEYFNKSLLSISEKKNPGTYS